MGGTGPEQTILPNQSIPREPHKLSSMAERGLSEGTAVSFGHGYKKS